MCSGYTADSYTADSVSRTFIWFYIADSLPDTPDYDSTIFNRKPTSSPVRRTTASSSRRTSNR